MESLIIAIVGLATTATLGVLGLYYTAKARSASLRQSLFHEQLQLALRAAQLVGRSRLPISILSSDDASTYREQAVRDLHTRMHELSVVVDDSSLLLPTDVYIELSKYSDSVSKFADAYESGADLPPVFEAINVQASKTILLMKAYLGVDELSDQNAALFSNTKTLKSIVSIPSGSTELDRRQ